MIELAVWLVLASDQPARVAALREAVACYTGPLAEGRTYEWIEPYREAVRRQAIDAHTALADALAASDPADAVVPSPKFIVLISPCRLTPTNPRLLAARIVPWRSSNKALTAVPPKT